MYLVYGTRPDITFAIRQLNKYNADPKKEYLQAIKKIVKYLKKTMEMGFTFERGTNPRNLLPYSLISYGNSNFVEDPEDRKSIIGYCFFLNRAIVS